MVWKIVSRILGVVLVAGPTVAHSDELRWSVYSNTLGARVDYPRSLLPVTAKGPTPGGTLFLSADGRAQLEIFSLRNRSGESPKRLIDRVRQQHEHLTYQRVSHNFFAGSTIRRTRILYRRCNFVDAMIHCIDMRYPLNEKNAWDRIVTRVSLSLRPH